MKAGDPVHAEREDSGRRCLQHDVSQNRWPVQHRAGTGPDRQQDGEQDGERRDSVGDLSQHEFACRDSGAVDINLILTTRPESSFLSVPAGACKPWHEAIPERNANPLSVPHHRALRGGQISVGRDSAN